MNEDKILVPLDDYEEKAKDQRTVEIIRDMVTGGDPVQL